jgi:hypothetical protein
MEAEERLPWGLLSGLEEGAEKSTSESEDGKLPGKELC